MGRGPENEVSPEGSGSVGSESLGRRGSRRLLEYRREEPDAERFRLIFISDVIPPELRLPVELRSHEGG